MNALVVGGSSGIGLSIVLNLTDRNDVNVIYVIDKNIFPAVYISDKIHFIQWDLSQLQNINVLDQVQDIQMLYVTAGFGHLKHFHNLDIRYIETSFLVNTIAPIEIVRYFYQKLLSKQPFYCGVMVSIAGRVCSPFFSIYSATKAALSKWIEAVNVELEMQNSSNRILEVSPGSIKGTSFTGGPTDPSLTINLATQIIKKSENHETLFIPQYNETFKHVIERYQNDPRQFGIESYLYKQERMNK